MEQQITHSYGEQGNTGVRSSHACVGINWFNKLKLNKKDNVSAESFSSSVAHSMKLRNNEATNQKYIAQSVLINLRHPDEHMKIRALQKLCEEEKILPVSNVEQYWA